MNIKRITISVPNDTAARIKKAASGMSVSAWVTDIIEQRFEDAELDRLWQDFYKAVQPRRTDIREANALFSRLTKRRRRNAGNAITSCLEIQAQCAKETFAAAA